MPKRLMVVLVFAGIFATAGGGVCRSGEYSPGADDNEIKIGNTMPYSGPASGYSAIVSRYRPTSR
jgi:branched-chain amino acid transport system substrate-binding protein